MVAIFTPPPFMMQSLPPVLTWVSATPAPLQNFASYTFTAQNIGTPAPDRLVIVCVMGLESNNGGASQIGSVSIGGVAATMHINPAGGREPTAIASAVIPTGTTADITCTRIGTTGGFIISVYTLTRYKSAIPVSVDGSNSSPAVTTRSATLNIPAKGFALYSLSKFGSGVPVWTAAAQNYGSVQASNYYVESRSKYSAVSLQGNIETATFAAGQAGISGAAWN